MFFGSCSPASLLMFSGSCSTVSLLMFSGSCSPASLFMFCTSIAPAITFAASMLKLTEEDGVPQIGPSEVLLATALTGVTFAVFAGQPLCVGRTGLPANGSDGDVAA